jgi:hypothetical protein
VSIRRAVIRPLPCGLLARTFKSALDPSPYVSDASSGAEAIEYERCA